jgi:predicted O-methyltransferase YrrM
MLSNPGGPPLFPESTWTPPRVECPHPEYWHAPDDDSAEIEVSNLVAAFVLALQPEYVVETGTAWGQTALAIGHALRENQHGLLDTIEPDPERVKHCRELTGDLAGTVYVREMSSMDFTPSGPIDFAWFDSLIHLRVPEFHRYLPYMHSGTVVGFHDCGPQHTLRPAVEQLAERGYIRPMYLPTPRGVIFAQVMK